MKTLLKITIISLFFLSCNSSKNTNTSKPKSNDSGTVINYKPNQNDKDGVTDVATTSIISDFNNSWQNVGPSKPFKDKLDWFNEHTETYWFGNGRVSSIWIDPNEDDHMLIGAAFSNLFETFDGGKNWNSITDDTPTLDITKIVKKNNTLYISTGYRFKNPIRFSAIKHDFYGYGILKSTDNGKTWSPPSGDFYCGDFSIGKTHNTIYVSSYSKVYKSTDNAISFTEVADFSNKTDSKVNDKIELFSVVVHPENPDLVYVSAAIGQDKNAKLLYKSTDGGKTWQNEMPKLYSLIKNKPEKSHKSFIKSVALFYDESSKEFYINYYVSFLFKRSANSKEYDKAYTYIIKSTDFKHFEYEYSQEILGGKHFLPKLYVKNGTYFLRAWYLHIKKPTDNKFTNIGSGKVHQDTRSVAVNSKGEIFYGHDAGIYKSIDDGKTWTNAFENLNGSLIFEMSYYSDKNTRRIGLGTQDTGFYLQDLDGTEKYPIDNFEGGIYISPHNKDRIYVKRYEVRVYSTQNKKYKKLKLNNGKPIKIQHLDGLLREDPLNKNRLYIGHVNDLIVSDKLGEQGTWRNITPKGFIGRSSDLAIPTSNTNILYLANYKVNFPVKNGSFRTYTSQSHLLKSTNLGKTWKNTTTSLNQLLTNSVISSVTVDNENPDKVWMCLRNLEANKKVYFSENGGKTWQNISYNLPNVPVNRIVYNNKLDLLLLANDQGVYYLQNNSWLPFGTNLPKVIVTSLEIDPLYNEVIVSTFGRGVWKVKIN